MQRLIVMIAGPVAALLMFAGCGVMQTPAQPGSQSGGATLQATVLSPLARSLGPQQLLQSSRAAAGRSAWMAPSAKGQDLVYVTETDEDAVDVFTYPGGQQVGALVGGFAGPEGECTDGKGNVWVANWYDNNLLEYAHGGTSPIKTLTFPDQLIVGCSVDRTSGSLAVDSYCRIQASNCVANGSVFVYADINKQPQQYFVGTAKIIYFSSWDSHGNLFVDVDETGLSVFGLHELDKGGSSFKEIRVDRPIYFPGGLEWSGKYLAVGDQLAGNQNVSSVHQVAIHGSVGKIVGTTRLQGVGDVCQFWIQGSTIVIPNIGVPGQPNNVRLYPYPAGGAPTTTFAGGQYQPIGTVVSLAQN